MDWFELGVTVAVDGREIWWAISAKPQLDQKGEFLGYRGSAKDITAVRESQRDASRTITAPTGTSSTS